MLTVTMLMFASTGDVLLVFFSNLFSHLCVDAQHPVCQQADVYVFVLNTPETCGNFFSPAGIGSEVV